MMGCAIAEPSLEGIAQPCNGQISPWSYTGQCRGYKDKALVRGAHMPDMEKLRQVGLVSATPPGKTTFPDGRMATKEAWNVCQKLCHARCIRAPTLRTFKWHLKHGNLIEADEVPNPFGGDGPDKVYAIRFEAVQKFVDELERQGDALHVVEKQDGTVVRRTTEGNVAIGTKNSTPEPELSCKELSTRDAFYYLSKKVGRRCQLNSATFGYYLAYDVIPSRWEERERIVRQEDLDTFLELAPDGIYANHIEYDIAQRRGPGMLSMKDAFAYYEGIDPSPITISTFRTLVTAAIIPAVRTANDPRAPIVGFRKRDIDAFLATRQRVIERNREATTFKPVPPEKEESGQAQLVQQIMDEEAQKALPKIEAERKAAEKKAASKKSRWVSVSAAYAHYEKRAPKPHSRSWFRKKVVEGEIFRVQVDSKYHTHDPLGRRFMVDIDSVDEYLDQDPKTKPKTVEAWPIEMAYHKFNDSIPDDLSLLRFKRLVTTGEIESFVKDDTPHVRRDAVEAYFAEEIASEELSQRTPASSSPKESETPSSPVDTSEVITISMSDYNSLADMKKALLTLTRQGFQVKVKP